MSGCIHHLSSSHSPVFLLNSCLDLFSAPPSPEDPFSRSYGVSLPSSLATDLSTPQYVLPDYVCPFAVRVPRGLKLSGFSREYGYLHYRLSPKGMPYFRISARKVDLPASLNTYLLQRGLPSPRGSVTAPSPRRPAWKSRNVDRVCHRTRRSAYP